MAAIIELPHVGESVVEGVIGKWLVQPGQRVQRFDAMVEVVTDKVTLEVPAPYDGVLRRILVEEGQTVPMGAPIAEMDTDDPVAAAPSTPSPQATPGTTGYLARDLQPVGPTGGVMAGPEEPEQEDVSPPRRRYSPAVRRLAQEHGIDLEAVPGTGMGGRLTRADIQTFIDARSQTTAPAVQPPATVVPSPGADEEVVPLTPVRRIIAEHLTRSASQIPHAWSMVEVDVNSLVSHRNRVKDEFLQRERVSLTYLPFVIKAVVEALKENPLLNSTWGGDKIILKKRINIGIAVAAPDGLIVPVVHDADSLSIAGLARATHDLTDRARQGKLSLDDVQEGTFTVNNTGALGSVVSQPIINHPQAGILTTETIQKRPVIVNDAIAIRSMMNVCLSFDHRVIDGAESSNFLQGVKRRLEAMGPDTPVY